METRQATTIRFYDSNRQLITEIYHGQIQHYFAFRNQLKRFVQANDSPASQQDIDCVCAENVITKAKIYHFSKN